MNDLTPRSPAISVIVPMFNVADYLRDCLDSLAAQDLGEPIELLVIDDASVDNSADICRDWMAEHPGLVTLLQNDRNRGVSIARNRGLDAATGRYFAFVDPDDLLPAGALSALYQAAESRQADIVKGNNSIIGSGGETAARYNVDKTSRHLGGDVLATLFRHEKLRGHPWGKLFRRDRLGEFRFTEGVRMAQDLLYCSEVFAHARSLVLIEQQVYRYRNHGGGSTGKKFTSGSYIDWLDAIENSVRFATDSAQRRAHRGLLVRTLAQLARESRGQPTATAKQVHLELERRLQRWDIRWRRLVFYDRLGLRALLRYLKLRLAIRQAQASWKSSAG